MATFKIENYITVPGFAIVELKLSGNELLCYSLIYGFTQDEETEFRGSLSYVASALNVTKQNAKKIIDRLICRGLVEKREMYFSGVKFCHYIANRHGVAETATGYEQNNTGGVAETATGGVVETIPNNTNKDNYLDKIGDNDRELFPTEFPVPSKNAGSENGKRKKAVKTSERECLFSNSKFYDFEKFKEQFPEPEFSDVDLFYYYNRVKNWSGANGRRKKDWILTAKNWMMDDNEKGKLKKIQPAGPVLEPDAIEYLREMGEGIV